MLAASPYRRVLFLDADTQVEHASIASLFALLAVRPTVIKRHLLPGQFI